VRINVQLIDVHTDKHLWAEIYDRELTTSNLFAIQSEISTAIADALQATLSPAEKSLIYDLSTSSMEAYNHFLRGRQLMASRKNKDLEQAHQEFAQATEADPEFALAWVGVADVVHLLEYQGAIARDKYLEVHKQAVDRALTINDQLGEAYASLASGYQDHGEDEKAEVAYLRAIELNPNYVQAYHWYAISGLVTQEEALQLLYKAAQLDPMSLIVQRNIAGTLGGLGRVEEGREVIQDLLQRDPTYASGYRWLGNIDADSGELAQAIQWFRKALPLDPGNGAALREAGLAYLALGDLEAVADIRAEMERHLGPDSDPSGDLEYWTYFAQSNWQEGIDWFASAPEEIRETRVVLAGISWLHYYAGDFEKALYYTLKREPGLATRERWQKDITDKGRYDCEYAGMMIEGGEEALGRDLLQLSIRNLEDPAISGDPKSIDPIVAAICYLLAGSIDKSMNWFEQAMTEDVRIQWWFYWGKNPWWKRLDDNPRYLALVEQIESKLTSQRALLKEMDELENQIP
jgi:tetratricopeptide (TPR) repeat protein